MSARIAMRATQEESADHLLVHWPEEDCVSVVALKNVVEPCPPILHNPCVIQTGKKTFTGVAVQIGSKRRLSELESDFVDGSFEIPVQQSEWQEAGKENVDESGPIPKTCKKRGASESGKESHVTLAYVNGNSASKEDGAKSKENKNKKRKTEKERNIQEPTGLISDEADHDPTFTIPLELKHITVIADIAKRLEDRIKEMQKDIDSKMKSIEGRMEDMQRDVKDLKCQLHTAECPTEKDLCREAIDLERSVLKERVSIARQNPTIYVRIELETS